jgi:DNA-binding transcriptional LysR family regulator
MLERSLGVQFFERTPTGLRLTDRGREAFEHTSAMFLAGERLSEVLGRGGGEPPIKLRVGVSSAVSRTIAAELLIPLLSLEQCRPSIRTGDFLELLRDLRARELDLLVGDTEPIEGARPNLELVTIHRPRLSAIAHPEADPRGDWRHLSLLEYRAASAYHFEVDNYLREKGLNPLPAGELDDAFLMLEAVARGGLIAFVPSSVARTAVKLGRVKVIATLTPASAGVHALYHRTESAEFARSAVEKLISNARQYLEQLE